jgi:RNA polymerase sigma factor (sigma-70 family)
VAELAQFRPRPGPEPDVALPRWFTEQALLSAVLENDAAAAEELVDRTYGAIYASLVRMCGDSELAADLTQETYQKAWAALRTFNGRSQIFTWLYRIAYTTFLNHVRRPRRMTSLEDSPSLEVRDAAPLADDIISDEQEGQRLRDAVLRLSDDLRFTVTAHYWGGLTVREIATIENITTVAVRKRLHKAFSILEAALEEDLR